MTYLRELGAMVRDAWRECREESNYFGFAILLLCLPLLFVATLLAAFCDLGPD